MKSQDSQDYKNFISSIMFGELSEVKKYINEKTVDPKKNNSECLRVAAEKGHVDIVSLLIPHTNPRDLNSLALRWACEKGHIKCVKKLLPHSDPKAEKSSPLRLSVMYGHHDLARFLFPLSNPSEAYDGLVERSRVLGGDQIESFNMLWDEFELKKEIKSKPPNFNPPKAKKM